MVLWTSSDGFALYDEYLWSIYFFCSIDVVYCNWTVSDLIFQHIILVSVLMAILLAVGVFWIPTLILFCVGGSIHFFLLLCSVKCNTLPGC